MTLSTPIVIDKKGTSHTSGSSQQKTPTSPVPSHQSLSLQLQIAYALPLIGFAFMANAVGIVQGIYTKYFGLSLADIATVILVARLFDAVTDPIIGYLSDRQFARTGSRKPMILTGGILFIVSCYFLFIPDGFTHNGITQVSTTYFLWCYLAFYLAYTLYEIPHQAWGSELAASATEKITLFSFRSAASLMGILLFSVVPLLPFFDNHAFTPETLKWSILGGGIVLLPALANCLKMVPANKERLTVSKLRRGSNKSPLALFMVLSNKPLLLFFTAYFFFAVGTGGYVVLVFIFVDSYLVMGEEYVVSIFYSTFVALFSLYAWRALGHRLGKKVAWIGSKLFYVLGFFLLVMLVPGKASFLALLVPLILIAIANAGHFALTPALLSEIVDYSTWKYRQDATASYFALYTFASKGFVAIGAALGLAITGWYGFDPANVVYSDDTRFGIHLTIFWLPVVFLAVSTVFVVLIPINTRRHSIIRRSLDKRAQRAAL